jgi:hypothetical protein
MIEWWPYGACSQEIYGDGYLRNLSALGEDAESLATMVTGGFLQPFWDTVRRSSVAVWVDCSQFADQPIFFWKVSERPALTTARFAQPLRPCRRGDRRRPGVSRRRRFATCAIPWAPVCSKTSRCTSS